MEDSDFNELICRLQQDDGPFQELQSTLKIIGDKWSVLILVCIFNRLSRFHEIEEALPDLNPRTLSKRLKNLETNGLITKQTFREFPPRVVYSPTQKAHDLRAAITELRKWARKYYREP